MLQQSHLLRNQPECKSRRLYRFFHSILEHYSFHQNIYYILIIMQIFQIANYGLHTSLGNIWDFPFANTIRKILSYTDLSPLWITASPIALIVFNSIWVIFNAIVLSLILYEVHKNPKKLQRPNIFAIKMCSYYSVFLKSILLIPLSVSFTSFLNKTMSQTTTSIYIILIIVSVLGAILIFTNIVLFIYYIRDNSPFSKLPFACSVGYSEQIRSSFKFLLGIYANISTDLNSTLVQRFYCSLFIIFCLIISYYQYSRVSFINKNIQKYQQAWFLTGLWIIICSFLQTQVDSDSIVGLILCFIGILLVPFAWQSFRENKRKSLLSTSYKAIHSSIQCIQYNYNSIYCANNLQDLQNLQYLEGILNYHIMGCKKAVELCVCHRLRQQLLQHKIDQQREDIQKQKKLWFQFIRSNLYEVKQKYQKASQIRFLLSYIENQVLMNKFRALHSLQQARQIRNGYKYEFLDYHYVRQIEKKMEAEDRIKNQKKTVDINRYFRFQMKFGQLQKLMEESTYQYVSFWQLLRSQKVTKQKLYNQGVQINKNLQQINRSYEALNHINRSNIHALVLFSNFMKVIVNNSEAYQRNQQSIESIKRTMAQSMKMNSDAEKQKYGDNSISAIIIISGERSNIGIIKHGNWKIRELIGYAPHQLIGQNINVLMPKFIGNMHDDVLRNYLELSQSQYDFVERLVPMIDSRNFMVLARMLTKPLPSLFNGLELVGIFNSIIETNINHPGQPPKYVLYRSDTGQVQALSQTCHRQFHYKINKIDENNETSSQLTFSTLFIGAKDGDIKQGIGFRCKILAKLPNTSQIQQVPVEVYERLQIYYYSVHLHLLCFYTLRTFRKMQETLNNGLQLQPDHLVNQWQKQSKTERSALNDKAVKQKFLHQMSKKNTLVSNEPTSFKALQILGYIYFLIAIGYSIFLIVSHTRTTVIDDFLQLIRLSGETSGDLCEIAFYSRIMHLSNFYPSFGKFSQFQGNMSLSVSSLQNGQFQIQKTFLDYGTFSQMAKQWTISKNAQISFVQTALDAQVFDLVTAASTYNQFQQTNLNFPFILTASSSTNTPQELQQLFFIRYSSLFQVIPKKQIESDYFNSLFIDLMNQKSSLSDLQLGLSLGYLLLFAIIMIPLTISLLNTINETIMLFGHMSRHQIEKQIDNCNSFLEIFYQDSYLIWLKKKQKMKEVLLANPYSMSCSNLNKIDKQQSNSKIGSYVGSQADFSIKQSPTYHNMIKASISKVQFLEKELQLRTEAQILESQVDQQNENQLLRGQAESESDSSIYEHLSQEKDKSKLLYILFYILLSFIIGGYFLGQYSAYHQMLEQIKIKMNNVYLAYNNINALKKVRLYSLQSLVDNTPFQNYKHLKNLANQSYNFLYLSQRLFDQEIITESQNTLYYSSLCSNNTIAIIKDKVKLFSSNLFSSSECQKLLEGVLEDGLRLSIVGYTETLYNMTNWKNQSQLVSNDLFEQVRRMQRYIQAPLRVYQLNQEKIINNFSSDITKTLLSLILGFFAAILFMWILLWRKNLKGLHGKLKQTRTILGFIPVRVFVKNTKLTKEYEKYIGDLMQ